jgi:hypothetical protein
MEREDEYLDEGNTKQDKPISGSVARSLEMVGEPLVNGLEAWWTLGQGCVARVSALPCFSRQVAFGKCQIGR